MKLDVSLPKSYLLDPHVETDSPTPIFKSTTQIISENWGVLICFGLILIGFLLFWLWKKNKRASKQELVPTPIIDPYKEAMLEIDLLQTAKPKLEPKPFIFRLSQILRVYVQQQFNLPALELTGEEFITEITHNSFLQKNFEQTLRAFVQKGDLIKYSPLSSRDEELNELLNSAKGFIQDAHKKWEVEQSARSEGATSSH
jgi:hypothetical protein